MKAILRSSSFVSFIGTNLYWVPIKCHTGRRSCKCCSEEGFAIQNCTSWVREAWFSLTSGLVLKMRAMIGNVIFLFPVCLPISPSPSPQDLPVQPISSQASHAPFLSLQVVVRAVTSFTVSAHRPRSSTKCTSSFQCFSASTALILHGQHYGPLITDSSSRQCPFSAAGWQWCLKGLR